MKMILVTFVALFGLSACTMNTPSMLNQTPMHLSKTTMMEQVKYIDLNDDVLSALAAHYSKNGMSALDLTMTYNPADTKFDADEAAHQLRHVKQALAKKNVTNVMTQTQAINGGTPSLLVSYDMAQVGAPYSCATMPGLYREGTTRHIGGYQFGCSVDTLMAQQIAHPTDLMGNSDMDIASGRRQAGVIDGHLRGEPKEPLDGIERDRLVTE